MNCTNGIHNGPVIGGSNGYQIIDCRACRFKHVVPLPSESEMIQYYSRDFLEKRPGYISKQSEDKQWLRIGYGEQFDLLEAYSESKKRRIIDIGCGLGIFLELGQERGWQPFGIEPSQQAVAYAKGRGLSVFNGTLCEDNVSDFGSFDAACLHEVLEHLPNPSHIIHLVKRLLNPEGLICIVVPNEYNPFQQAACVTQGLKAWWQGPPEHLNYFDVASLKDLLNHHGFEVISTSTTFPMEMFLLMDEIYVDNPEIGRLCHLKRKKFEQALYTAGLADLKKELYRKFATLGIGREIVMLAQVHER